MDTLDSSRKKPKITITISDNLSSLRWLKVKMKIKKQFFIINFLNKYHKLLIYCQKR